MTTFTSEDREMAAKHDGIESPHNACCYKNKCLQQQLELTQWKALSNFESKTLEDCNTCITKQQAEIEALKKESDEILKGIKRLRCWLESTCPDGFADETFRCLPVWLLRKVNNK
ncbi:hypothetical protein [Polynucleobacter sp. MWH-Berg-3C6]|uniref:hypothetical protein n=1 Tax=Polynucleobacter sp. MWH-Berg-3C6 TaxID=1855882 RepID=UPI001C0B2F1D|nr:hypothetical protein [Polynucleobacter sp. MWH-Berg-3C6]MBU3551398.1 hypothetical protein [Polynucleobacter sp. MWH-Berg-3C6]